MSDELNPEIRISLIADTQRGQQSIAAIQQLVAGARAEVEKFAQSGGLGRLAEGNLDAANAQIDDLGVTLAISEGRARLLETAIEAVGDASPSLGGLTDRLEEVQKQADAARQEIEAIPAALADSAKIGTTRRTGFADIVGAAERPFAQVAGTASFLGVGQNSAVTQSLRGVSEITGTIEALGRMRQTVAGLKETTGASTLSLGALGVALLAIGPALSLLKDRAKEATGPFRDLADGFDREVELLEYRNQITAQSQAQIEAERRQQEQLVAVYERQVQQAQAAIDGTEKALDSFSGNIPLLSDGITKVFDLAGYDADVLKDKLPELQKNLETARQKLEALNDPLIQISLAAQQAEAAYLQQLDFEKQRQQLIESGTPEQIANLRTAAEQERAAIANSFGDFGDAIQDQVLAAARNSGLEEELQTLFRNSAAFGGDIPTQTNAYVELAQLLGIELPESIFKTVDTFNTQIDRMNELDQQISFFNSAAINEAIATRDKEQQQLQALHAAQKETYKADEIRTATIEALTAAQNEAIAAETKHTQALLDDAAKTSQSITQLEKSRADQLAKQQQADAEAAVIAGFRSQIDAAKATEAEQARANKITALRQDEQTKEIQALQKHEADKAKAQAAFDLAQRRKQEDLADDLNEAAADRDVRSFLRIQKQGQKELDRAQEDNDLRQREQDTALTEQIRQIRQDANERIRVERDSGQRRITQVQRLEQQLADYQTSLARQRQQQERQIQAQSYQEQITAWRTHLSQVSQELLTGLVNPLRGALGLVGGGVAVAPLPVGANVGAGALRGGAGVSVAITIQQQNNGRFASAEDLVRVENNNRTMLQAVAQSVTTAVQRARANTGGRH